MLSRRKLLQHAIAAAAVTGSDLASASSSWLFFSVDQSGALVPNLDQIVHADEVPDHNLAESTATDWMVRGRYGIFVHYQYRILLGYSIKTKPQFPNPAQMKAEEWNRFVEGFDVKGFAEQMVAAKAGWVIFCADDHYFAWQCAPNKTFSKFTGYAPGEKCSRRDLIMELAEALNDKGVKLIVY